MDKVIYYKDELNDDFAGNNIKTKDVPDNFVLSLRFQSTRCGRKGPLREEREEARPLRKI